MIGRSKKGFAITRSPLLYPVSPKSLIHLSGLTADSFGACLPGAIKSLFLDPSAARVPVYTEVVLDLAHKTHDKDIADPSENRAT
jgi:hypothetical protein